MLEVRVNLGLPGLLKTTPYGIYMGNVRITNEINFSFILTHLDLSNADPIAVLTF